MNSLQRVFQLIILFTSIASSQVMNDAKILSKGDVNIGITPTITNSSFGLYSDLGYGVARGMDLDLIAGFLNGGTYIGANLEFPLASNPNISFAVGGHTQGGTAGVDGTLNISFPLTNTVGMYLGADADLNFANGSTTLPLWAFVAVNAKIRHNIELFIEVDPAISNAAANIFSGGVKIYF